MALRTVEVRLADRSQQSDLVHRMRNYGEDVYRYTRDNGMGEVDLGEVDAAKSHFSIHRVAQRKARDLFKWLEKEAARQNLAIVTTVA